MTEQQCYDLFIESMAAFLRGEQTTLPVSSMVIDDHKRLYKLAKRQSLSGALHTATAQQVLPAPMKDRLRRDSYVTLAVYEQQQAAIADIAAAFDRDGIDHLFFKGAVVRRYYSTPAMRSMGDIDMLIHEADRDAADAAMRAIGYESSPESSEVWVYRKDDCVVEIHTVVRRFHIGKQLTEIYDTMWDDAVKHRGHTYRLNDEAETAHVIGHLIAHFCSGGCGLRQLMDVAVLADRFRDEDFWERVTARLEMIEAVPFTRHLLWLCREWFGVTVPTAQTAPLSEALQAEIKTRLLAEGTFGNDERMMFARMRREQKQHRTKTQTVWRWLFPTTAYLKQRYAYAAKHGWLLPAAYIHRLSDGVFKNRKTHRQRLTYLRENEASMQAEATFFDQVGL